MTTVQLQYFIEAADTLNFTAAAERLFTSQPALSRQIAALEHELGVKLFQRSNNILGLTPAGTAFRQRAVRLYQDFQTVATEVRDVQAGVEGHLRIGLLEDQQITPHLIDGIHHLMQDYSNAAVDIIRGSYRDLMEKLIQGTLDICQVTLYDGMDQGGYQTLALSEEQLYLAVSRKFHAMETTELTQAQLLPKLEGCPIIAAAPSTYPETIQSFLPAFGMPHVRYVEGLSSIPLYVVTGLGAALINIRNLLALEPHVQLIKVTDIPPVTQGCIWRRDNTNALVLELLQVMQKTVHVASISTR